MPARTTHLMAHNPVLAAATINNTQEGDGVRRNPDAWQHRFSLAMVATHTETALVITDARDRISWVNGQLSG